MRAHLSVQACAWASVGECECVHCFIMFYHVGNRWGCVIRYASPPTPARHDTTLLAHHKASLLALLAHHKASLLALLQLKRKLHDLREHILVQLVQHRVRAEFARAHRTRPLQQLLWERGGCWMPFAVMFKNKSKEQADCPAFSQCCRSIYHIAVQPDEK